MSDSNIPVWSVHDIFVQVNVLNGFRYLDLTGQLLNVLADRYRVIDAINPRGTHLVNPKDNRDPIEIQFGPTRIWLHYAGIDAVQKVESTAPEMLKSIAEKLEMKQFDRYGVRVNYFIQTDNVFEAGAAVTRKLVSEPIAEAVSIRRTDIRTNLEIPLIFDDTEAILRFRWLVINRPASSPAEFSGDSLILDIDLGQRSNGAPFQRKEFAKLMSRTVKTHTELLIKYGQPLIEGLEL